MPFDNILSSLLMKVNQCYLDNDIEVAQKEILQIICTEFSSVYCTVYLKKDDSYQQYSEYTLPETSSFSFELTNLNLHNKPFYIDKRENIHHISQESQVQRYLYLPLLRKKRLYGFLLVLWDKSSLFDQDLSSKSGFLLSLSLILEKTYDCKEEYIFTNL